MVSHGGQVRGARGARWRFKSSCPITGPGRGPGFGPPEPQTLWRGREMSSWSFLSMLTSLKYLHVSSRSFIAEER